MKIKSYLFIALLIFTLTLPLYAEEIREINIAGDTIFLELTNDMVRILPVNESILEVVYFPNNVIDYNTALITPDLVPAGSFVSIDSTSNPTVVSFINYKLKVHENPFYLEFLNSQEQTLFTTAPDSGFTGEKLIAEVTDGSYYGIRNKYQGGLSFSGSNYIYAGMQGGAGSPFLWTPEGFGLITDTDLGSISLYGTYLTLERRIETYRSQRDGHAIYLMIGDVHKMYENYHIVTGFPPMPPIWGLGFLNSEWMIDENELLNDIRTYREKDIPLDSYILDFDWMDYGSDYYGEFRWNHAKFPSANSGMLKDSMEKYGVHLMGIRKPRIHGNTLQGNFADDNGYFIDWETDYFTGKRVGRLDFYNSEVRDWYWESFIDPEYDSYARGIEGFWNDEADQYGGTFNFLYMQACQYNGQREYNNNRVFSLNRNYFGGSQRYAYGMWSGDIPTGFEILASHPTIMLSSVILGASWWTMDIGGFDGTPSPENYYRWMQMGAFIAIFRVHGTLYQEREPWNYGEEAEEISKRYIQLRYELLPYIYSAFRKLHKSGLPPIRPLFFDYPDDPALKDYSDSWLFGDFIHASAITREGAHTMSIYFPEGNWYDLFSDEKIEGGQYLRYNTSFYEYPVFVRQGAIIPRRSPGKHTGDTLVLSGMSLHVYPGDTASFELYEDDGLTYDYEDGNYLLTEYFHESSDEEEIVDVVRLEGVFSPNPRSDYWIFHDITVKPESVSYNDQELRETDWNGIEDSTGDLWTYDQEKMLVKIRLNDPFRSGRLRVLKGKDLTPPGIDSVYLVEDTVLMIKFTEAVLIDSSEHGALNLSNYTVEPQITIHGIYSSANLNRVMLRTDIQYPGRTYTLNCGNISDLSSEANIMEWKSVSYQSTGDSLLEIVLQDGSDNYTGTDDAHISEFYPDNNAGEYAYLEAGRYDGRNENNDKSIVIKFEIPSLTEEIEKMVLNLVYAGRRNGDAEKTLHVHRLLKDWGEGDESSSFDGTEAGSGEVSWNYAQAGSEKWNLAGGDFTSSIDSVTINFSKGDTCSFDITPISQTWVEHPDSNFGVIIREKNPSNQDGSIIFYSSENNKQSSRPFLEIDYYKYSEINETGSKTNLADPIEVYQNYPNPCRGETVIPFQLKKNAPVKIEFYNVLGNKVKTTAKKDLNAGRHEIKTDLTNLPTGIYFYRLVTDRATVTKKLLIIR